MTNAESKLSVKHKPIESSAAWRGTELVESDDWIHQFGQTEISELQNALRHAKSKGLSGTQVSVRDFPLPSLSAVIESLVDELVEGAEVLSSYAASQRLIARRKTPVLFFGVSAHTSAKPGYKIKQVIYLVIFVMKGLKSLQRIASEEQPRVVAEHLNTFIGDS